MAADSTPESAKMKKPRTGRAIRRPTSILAAGSLGYLLSVFLSLIADLSEPAARGRAVLIVFVGLTQGGAYTPALLPFVSGYSNEADIQA